MVSTAPCIYCGKVLAAHVTRPGARGAWCEPRPADPALDNLRTYLGDYNRGPHDPLWFERKEDV
jgi:hypothetical protein